MNHRLGRIIFGLVVGLGVAFFAYQWISNPAPREQRAQEESAVASARDLLRGVVVSEGLEIVDPLAPNRKVGKAYVYAESPGWAVSGYYRRNQDDQWHPYLLTMNSTFELHKLKVQDPQLSARASVDPTIEVVP